MGDVNKETDMPKRWDADLFRPIAVPDTPPRPQAAIDFERAENAHKVKKRGGVFVFVNMAEHNAKRKARLNGELL